MRRIEIKDIQRENWNKFIIENSSESFLQSWEWGNFQQAIGKKISRIGVEEGGEILAVALLIRSDLPFGKSYFYFPRGPVLNRKFIKSKVHKIVDFLFDEIKKIAKKEKVIFLKIDPPSELNQKSRIRNQEYINKCQKSLSEVQPKDTLMLNLERSEEDLLKEMKQKTRYNVRLAEKKGVQISSYEVGSTDQNEFHKKFESFWDLTEETSRRNKIISHNRDYYQKMLEGLSVSNKTDLICHSEFISESARDDGLSNHQFAKQSLGNVKQKSGDTKKILNQVQNDSICSNLNLIAKLYLAEYEGKIIAANIVLCFGDLAIYLHGASASEHRNLMAPYLLQWKQIKDAKNAGCKKYDFWGITISGEKESWQGITKFKKGFGGVEKSYIGSYDLIIDKRLYGVYLSLKKIRKKLGV